MLGHDACVVLRAPNFVEDFVADKNFVRASAGGQPGGTGFGWPLGPNVCASHGSVTLYELASHLLAEPSYCAAAAKRRHTNAEGK